MAELDSLTMILARHVVDRSRSVTPELDRRMRLLLFDDLAIARTGIRVESAQSALAAIGGGSPHRSDAAPARIEGIERFAPVADAAFVNGVSSHGLELDDTHEEASLHPGVAVWPATLALADELDSTADDVIRAAVVGYDVTCAVGVLIGASEAYGRGFHPTGIAGIVGAAAACASLAHLSESQTSNALSVAANMASGSLEFLSDGSWTKRLNAGNAAAQGVRSYRLGQAGFLGPATAIEGSHGMLVQYGAESSESRELVIGFGSGATETSVKFYPCCRYMHGNIDLLRSIHDDLGGVRPQDVARFDVGVIRAGQSLVSVPSAKKLLVESTVDAQFNMPFGAALALSSGAATLDDFADAPRRAATLREWLPKVTSYTSDRLEAAYPKVWKAEVSVQLRDGAVISRSADSFKGAPGDPASWTDIQEKATSLLGADQAADLGSRILTLRGDGSILEHVH
jgi:2-methylcitrate dehydratase PrpD